MLSGLWEEYLQAVARLNLQQSGSYTVRAGLCLGTMCRLLLDALGLWEGYLQALVCLNLQE